MRALGHQAQSEKTKYRINEIDQRHRSPVNQTTAQHLREDTEDHRHRGSRGEHPAQIGLRHLGDISYNRALEEAARQACHRERREQHRGIARVVKYQPGHHERYICQHHCSFPAQILRQRSARQTADWHEK